MIGPLSNMASLKVNDQTFTRFQMENMLGFEDDKSNFLSFEITTKHAVVRVRIINRINIAAFVPGGHFLQ